MGGGSKDAVSSSSSDSESSSSSSKKKDKSKGKDSKEDKKKSLMKKHHHHRDKKHHKKHHHRKRSSSSSTGSGSDKVKRAKKAKGTTEAEGKGGGKNISAAAPAEDEAKSFELSEKRDQVLTQIKEDSLKKLKKGEREGEFLLMKDYYRKNREFMLWFHETTGISFGSLKNTQAALEHFFTFAKLWNSKQLPSKYYNEANPGDLEPTVRTAYKWKFADKVDTLELATARDSVDTDTNVKAWTELPREFRKRREGEAETERDRERRERFQARERVFAERDPFAAHREQEEKRKQERRQREKLNDGY